MELPCICLNWLSGALGGVGGSDFVGYLMPPWQALEESHGAPGSEGGTIRLGTLIELKFIHSSRLSSCYV